MRIFLQAFTRRHVPRATCHRWTPDRYHRRSGVSGHRSVPAPSRSDQPFGRYSRKCLDTHTYIHTDKHDPANFFSPTHRRKSSFIRTCYAKALAPFILYDFGLEAGIAKHCLGAKIVDIAIFRFGSVLVFTAKVPYQFARAHVLHALHHLVTLAIDICSQILIIVPIFTSLCQNFPKSGDSHSARALHMYSAL